MTQYKIERAIAWEQIEEAATVANKCIRPDDGLNWRLAKETWETLGEQVIYFIVRKSDYPNDVAGYVRLFNTTPPSYVHNPTWAVDFMCPNAAEIVVRIADELPGNVLVKSFFGDEVVARRWPKVALSLAIPEAPYRIANNKEADWLVVMP